MLIPVKIDKLRLIGLQKDQQKALNVLYEFGQIHPKNFSFKGLEKGNPNNSSNYSEIVSSLLKIDGMLSILPYKKVSFQKNAIPIQKALHEFKNLDFYDKLLEIKKELKSIKTQKQKLNSQIEKIKPLRDFKLNFSELKLKSVGFVLGILPNEQEKFLSGLKKISKKHDLIKKFFNKTHKLVLIVASKKELHKIINFLNSIEFEEFFLPDFNGTLSDLIAKLRTKISELNDKKIDLEFQIKSLSERNYEKLVFLKEIFEIEKRKFEGNYFFGKTKDLFVFECYIPNKLIPKFKDFFSKHFDGKYFLDEISAKKLLEQHEHTPTVLSNPKHLGPFEFMIKFMSTPKSFELDPSVVYFWFFPIFYGMIVGDALYGVASLILSFILFSKLSKEHILRPIAAILMYASIPTIIFGILFDEYFGFSHSHLLEKFGFHQIHLYHGMERIENIPILIAGIILVGLITICFGFLLGAINAFQEKHYKHVIAKLAWIFFLVSLTIVISSSMFNYLTEWTGIALPVLIISFIPIVLFEGIIGIIEIPSVIGNILSFVRIIAVGLVGVIIAIILNQLLFPDPNAGLIMMIVLVSIYLLTHTFNIILAMFEALVQGSRLNFVELFSKFYHGGGIEFSPFKYERKYTKK